MQHKKQGYEGLYYRFTQDYAIRFTRYEIRIIATELTEYTEKSVLVYQYVSV